MRVFSIFATLTCLLIVAACTKDIGPNPDLVKKSLCDTVSFNKHIKPIIVNKCVVCHVSGTSSGAPGDFNNYSELKTKADAGLIKARVIDQTPSVMPQGGPPLPQEQLDMIKCWLEAGAPNN
jgi:hypothetical protein